MRCWFFRLMISDAADSDRPLGPATRRHILRCANCRQFQRSCHLLAEGLRSEATPASPASRTDFRSIRRWYAQRPIWAGFAAAACIVLVTLAGISLPGRPTKSVRPPLPPVLAVAVMRVDLTTAWTRAIETPLITEAQNLSNDAQSGIRFLVSCLSIRPFDHTMAQPVEPRGPSS